ncbi:MAG: hypothetical protein ACOCT8_02705 [Actinomycetota bacterium]
MPLVDSDEDDPSAPRPEAGLRARSAAGASRVPDAPQEVRLGLFDPAVVGPVTARLERAGVAHTTVEHDGSVELRIDRGERDDVRSELAINWDEVVAELEEEQREHLDHEGPAPGWLDAPRGGHIDRAGRLVVDADDTEEWESSRVLGPGLLVGGAAIGLLGWLLVDSGALITLGIAMVAIGVFIPR